jgi:hypothetical protein
MEVVLTDITQFSSPSSVHTCLAHYHIFYKFVFSGVISQGTIGIRSAVLYWLIDGLLKRLFTVGNSWSHKGLTQTSQAKNGFIPTSCSSQQQQELFSGKCRSRDLVSATDSRVCGGRDSSDRTSHWSKILFTSRVTAELKKHGECDDYRPWPCQCCSSGRNAARICTQLSTFGTAKCLLTLGLKISRGLSPTCWCNFLKLE